MNSACPFCSPQGITLVSSRAVSSAKKLGWPLKEVATGIFEAEAPGGYKFYLEDKEQLKQGETCALAPVGVQERFTGGMGCAFVSLEFYETEHVFVISLLKNVQLSLKLQYVCK